MTQQQTQEEIEAQRQEEYALAFEGFVQTLPPEAVVDENSVYGSRAEYRRSLQERGEDQEEKEQTEWETRADAYEAKKEERARYREAEKEESSEEKELETPDSATDRNRPERSK